MIRKLKHKFIAINMLLAGLVLVIVMVFLMAQTWREQDARVTGALERAWQAVQSGTVFSDTLPADSPDGKLQGSRFSDSGPAGRALSFNSAPTFWAELGSDDADDAEEADETDEADEIVDYGADGVTLSEDTLEELVEAALESGKTEGTLSAEKVRFRIGTVDGTTYLVFVDESSSMGTVESLGLNLLAVGAASMAAFWLISWFLAGWALRPVQKAWEDQRRFVADASHELKTPLTVILANTDIVRAHADESVSSQKKWLDSTKDEGARMKKLIDDLLYLAKSDAAQQKPVLSRVDVSDLVEGSILSFESVAFEAGVAVEQEITPKLAVMGDEGSLRRLITILLDNACKYAAKEKRVDVTLRREKDCAVLTVANTGEPLPPDVLPHLFERFYRADGSRARTDKKAGGYGLGLAIARTIAENMRGSISAQSDEKGTRFLVRMPLA